MLLAHPGTFPSRLTWVHLLHVDRQVTNFPLDQQSCKPPSWMMSMSRSNLCIHPEISYYEQVITQIIISSDVLAEERTIICLIKENLWGPCVLAPQAQLTDHTGSALLPSSSWRIIAYCHKGMPPTLRACLTVQNSSYSVTLLDHTTNHPHPWTHKPLFPLTSKEDPTTFLGYSGTWMRWSFS